MQGNMGSSRSMPFSPNLLFFPRSLPQWRPADGPCLSPTPNSTAVRPSPRPPSLPSVRLLWMKRELLSLQFLDQLPGAFDRDLIAYRQQYPPISLNRLVDLDALLTHFRSVPSARRRQIRHLPGYDGRAGNLFHRRVGNRPVPGKPAIDAGMAAIRQAGNRIHRETAARHSVKWRVGSSLDLDTCIGSCVGRRAARSAAGARDHAKPTTAPAIAAGGCRSASPDAPRTPGFSPARPHD